MKLKKMMAGVLLGAAAMPAFGDEIQHDAEHYILLEQHAERWSLEDRQLSKKLAEMKNKHGKTPNIIHIMWDDNSLGEVGIPELNKVFGYETPNINQMADEGISFTRMYTEPSCTPTRAAALTGRLAVRSGMHKVGFPPDGSGLPKEEITIAEVLSQSGYRTAFVGKGHQGDIEESYLHNQGFDYANFSMYNQFPFVTWQIPAALAGASQGHFPFQWDKNYALDKKFRALDYVNQLEAKKGEKARVYIGNGVADYKKLIRDNQKQVVDYIKSHGGGDKPFYLAYWPHVYDPVRKPNELTTSASTWFAESLVDLDRDIGQIMEVLKQQGVAENTLVVAMADNGPMHELAPQGPHEAIFRGGKGDSLEGGIRVPAFAWWPGTIAEKQVVGDIVSVHDLFTTFISIAGAADKIPTDRVIDGIDQTAVLLLGDGHSRRDYLHIYTGDFHAATIKQQYKRDWTNERPGLVGDSFYDVYKDQREEHASMAPYLWAWAAFDHMKKRHSDLIEKHPNRPRTLGIPYQGITNLQQEAKDMVGRLPR